MVRRLVIMKKLLVYKLSGFVIVDLYSWRPRRKGLATMLNYVTIPYLQVYKKNTYSNRSIDSLMMISTAYVKGWHMTHGGNKKYQGVPCFGQS